MCSYCQSVYEIKSARTQSEAIKKLDSCVNGGLFYEAFYQVKRSLPVSAKMFLALEVSQPFHDGEDTNLNKNFPVYVGTIETVQPQLKNESFRLLKKDQRYKIYTRIILKKDSRRFWFHCPDIDFDGPKMAAKALTVMEKNSDYSREVVRQCKSCSREKQNQKKHSYYRSSTPRSQTVRSRTCSCNASISSLVKLRSMDR